MIPGFEDSLKNAIPPASPASAGGQPLAIAFPGVGRPSGDLAAVRDGRRSVPLGYLVDLSAAHTIAAGTQITVPLQGNTFMADPLYDLTGLAQAGIARVHFEGENVTPYDTYVTALPGAIYRVPFTKVTIENYAQAGKFLYIVYGIDLDLVPGQLQLNDITDRASRLLGIVAGDLAFLRQAAINGPIPSGGADQALITRDVGYSYGASFDSSANLGINAAEQIFAAASNVNGAMLWESDIFTQAATGGTSAVSLVSHTVAPAAFADGHKHFLVGDGVATAAGNTGASGNMPRSKFIASGRGAWFFNSGSVAEGAARRRVQYTLF